MSTSESAFQAWRRPPRRPSSDRAAAQLWEVAVSAAVAWFAYLVLLSPTLGLFSAGHITVLAYTRYGASGKALG